MVGSSRRMSHSSGAPVAQRGGPWLAGPNEDSPTASLELQSWYPFEYQSWVCWHHSLAIASETLKACVEGMHGRHVNMVRILFLMDA